MCQTTARFLAFLSRDSDCWPVSHSNKSPFNMHIHCISFVPLENPGTADRISEVGSSVRTGGHENAVEVTDYG